MTLTFTFLVFFLAGLVKGVLGMGLPTVAVALLVLVMEPVEASALLLIPSFLTNLWQLYAGPSLGQLLKRLWPMMTSILIGTVVAAQWLISSGNGWISAVLGLSLVAYGIVGLMALRLRVPHKNEPFYSTVAGLLTGLITGTTGVFVMPAVPYLQALKLDKETLIQALGLSFTVSTIALGVGMSLYGGLQATNIGSSSLMLLPALIGLYVGQRVRHKLSEHLFRRVFFIGLLVLGAHSLVRGVL